MLKYLTYTPARRRQALTPILSRFPFRVFLDLQRRMRTLAHDRRETGDCKCSMAHNHSMHFFFSDRSLFPVQHGLTAVARPPGQPPTPAVDERNAAEAAYRAR